MQGEDGFTQCEIGADEQINWLHFPTARDLMTRLITKYERFIEIVAVAVSTKDKVAVPTIDVDLAWHTHQLSPKAYFDYTVAKMEASVDHNDKVDEDKLSTAFEWTSKTYQEMYGEVYSECKCWYCESESSTDTRASRTTDSKHRSSAHSDNLLEQTANL